MAIYTPAREASGGTNGARCLNLTSGLQDWETAARGASFWRPLKANTLCVWKSNKFRHK